MFWKNRWVRYFCVTVTRLYPTVIGSSKEKRHRYMKNAWTESKSDTIIGGKYYEVDASLGKKALELFHRAVTFGNDTKIGTYVSARVRGVVTRMGTGDRVQVLPSVVVYAFAGHLGNLTLLDRVLAETETVLSPKAQEALDRILALRSGQVPQRAKELIQRLGGDTDDPSGT